MANDWKFERVGRFDSSDSHGWRCPHCKKRVDFYSPLICNCPIPVADYTINEVKEKIVVLNDELKDIQIELKTEKQRLAKYLRMNREKK